MFTNDDKQFLSDLNDKLAASLSKAMGMGPSPSTGGGGNSPVDKNTDAVEENTKAERAGSAAMKAGAMAFTAATGKLSGAVNQTLAFGNVLARSSVATGQSMSLMGAKFDSSTKQFTNQLPALSSAFKQFGLAPAEMGKILDSAIRANVRDTGRSTQKFVATSVGLGNNLSTTTKFLATQTNVLGMNTEATNMFGQSVLAMAASNGILADSIFDAVNAFSDTAQEQMVFFGRASTEVTQNAINNMAALLPDSDVAGLMTALTSSDVVRQLPLITGQLGVPMVGNLSDPANMRQLIESVLPALAQMGEGVGGDLASIERQKAFARIAPIFDPKNLQIAMRLNEELQKQGKTFSELSKTARISEKGLADAAGTITRTSEEAVKAAISQGAFERLLTGSRIALDDLNAAILDTPKNINALTEQISRLVTGLEALGLSIGAILAVLGGPKLAKALLTRSAAAVGGGTAAAGAAGAAGAALKSLSRADMIKALTPKQMAKFGISVSPTGAAGISKEGAKLLGQASAGTLTNKSLEKLMAQSARGGALRTAGRIGGKLAAPLAGAITGGFEYADSGDVSRAVTRGAAETGGVLASMGAGAAIGTAIGGPVGTIIGGGIGLLGSIFAAPAVADAAVGVHDAIGFYEEADRAADMIQGRSEMVESSMQDETLELERQRNDLLEGIFQNTLGTNVAGEESSRFRFSTPPEWQRSSGGYFTSPTQR